jgi:hypothetical protein
MAAMHRQAVPDQNDIPLQMTENILEDENDFRDEWLRSKCENRTNGT